MAVGVGTRDGVVYVAVMAAIGGEIAVEMLVQMVLEWSV